MLVLIRSGWPWLGGCSIAPQYLHLSLDANLILGLIGLLMLTTLFGSAFRIVERGRTGVRLGAIWQPLVAAFADTAGEYRPLPFQRPCGGRT